jgi:hypothetical protein
MKEIPMLFSTPMVQAILEGRKTQTRRLAAVPAGDHHGTDIMDWGLSKHPYQDDGKWLYAVQTDVDDSRTFELKNKYGKPGDLLWVREKWYAVEREGQGIVNQFIIFEDEWKGGQPNELAPLRPTEKFYRWGCHPSIHLPKYAARIWLQVTDIRVERLQDIEPSDAIEEGITEPEGLKRYIENGIRINGMDAGVFIFKELWQSINGPESWELNPFVWCVGFKVLSTTGKPSLTSKLNA